MSKEKFSQMKEVESAQLVQWDTHNQINNTPLAFTQESNIELFGLEPIKAQTMVKGLDITLSEREVLKNAYIDVIELEINSENLPVFKELRLKIVKNRTQGLKKWHEKEKSFYLNGGRFIDSIYNKEVLVNEEMESKLMEAEKFFENQEKQKAKDLNDSRIAKIAPWVDNAENMNFKEFSDEDFDDFVFGKKLKFDQRLAEEKAEAERIEKERIEKEEYIRLQAIENAKLKAEADLKAKELEKERAENARILQEQVDKNNAILKAEQQAKAKIEAELKEKQLEEDRVIGENNARIIAEEKAKQQLAKAPLKKQMNVWIDSFSHAEIKENETSKNILEKFDSFKKWAKLEIEKL